MKTLKREMLEEVTPTFEIAELRPSITSIRKNEMAQKGAPAIVVTAY
jgi:hypothetical protein